MAAHDLNTAAAAIDWRARGATEGTIADWRELHRAAFQAINGFHQAARDDLGVSGNFQGEQHSARDLILPNSRRDDVS